MRPQPLHAGRQHLRHEHVAKPVHHKPRHEIGFSVDRPAVGERVRGPPAAVLDRLPKAANEKVGVDPLVLPVRQDARENLRSGIGIAPREKYALVVDDLDEIARSERPLHSLHLRAIDPGMTLFQAPPSIAAQNEARWQAAFSPLHHGLGSTTPSAFRSVYRCSRSAFRRWHERGADGSHVDADDGKRLLHWRRARLHEHGLEDRQQPCAPIRRFVDLTLPEQIRSSCGSAGPPRGLRRSPRPPPRWRASAG